MLVAAVRNEGLWGFLVVAVRNEGYLGNGMRVWRYCYGKLELPKAARGAVVEMYLDIVSGKREVITSNWPLKNPAFAGKAGFAIS